MRREGGPNFARFDDAEASHSVGRDLVVLDGVGRKDLDVQPRRAHVWRPRRQLRRGAPLTVGDGEGPVPQRYLDVLRRERGCAAAEHVALAPSAALGDDHTGGPSGGVKYLEQEPRPARADRVVSGLHQAAADEGPRVSPVEVVAEVLTGEKVERQVLSRERIVHGEVLAVEVGLFALRPLYGDGRPSLAQQHNCAQRRPRKALRNSVHVCSVAVQLPASTSYRFCGVKLVIRN